jgi:cytidylate kinase
VSTNKQVHSSRAGKEPKWDLMIDRQTLAAAGHRNNVTLPNRLNTPIKTLGIYINLGEQNPPKLEV